MRVLIVNPNTSEGVTRRIAAAARAVAAPGDVFTTVSAASGPALIVTEADAALAVQGVLGAVERHGGDVDGIILGSFGDTGADEVRALCPGLPVIGIAAAGFGAARDIGGQFAIVTFAPEVGPSLRVMARRLGMEDRLHCVAALPGPLAVDPADVAEVLHEPLAQLCLECAAPPVSSILLGGGPLAGLAARIAPRCPVPVIDGTQAAILHLRAMLARPVDGPVAAR